MGPHAGEGEIEIFKRIILDVENIGRTYWLYKSHKAKPDMVQMICKHAHTEGLNVPCIFVEPSLPGGSIPTKTSDGAKLFSADNQSWTALSDELTPVTGKIDKGAYALVFDKLNMEKGQIDLWDYVDFFKPSKPLRIMQGGSTLCALRQQNSEIPDSDRIISRYRNIIAIGTLCKPYSVWLK